MKDKFTSQIRSFVRISTDKNGFLKLGKFVFDIFYIFTNMLVLENLQSNLYFKKINKSLLKSFFDCDAVFFIAWGELGNTIVARIWIF